MNPAPNGTDSHAEAAYDELRRLARTYLRRERPDHTLQPTGLVNETWLRMTQQRNTLFRNRAHFVGVAAHLMRRVLREHARGRHAEKRGGYSRKLTLRDEHMLTGHADVEFLAIERCLEQLAELDPAAARVVELRFFGGLTNDETAAAMAVSAPTVKRHWTVARAFIVRHLRPESA